MRFISYIASLILHIGLILIIVFWPTKTIVRPERPIQISLTMESIGGGRLPSPVLGQQIPVPTKTSTVTPSIPIENIPILKNPSVQTSSDFVPLRQETIGGHESQNQLQPIAVPVREEIAVNERIEQKIPTEKILDTPKAKQELAKKVEKMQPKGEPAKKIVKKTEPIGGSASLKDALLDAKKKTNIQKSQKVSPNTSVTNALAGFKKQTSTVGGGGGVSDGNGGGGGLHDIYAGLVMMSVRPNWSIPTYSRDNLVALVHVRIDADGNVLSCVIERSSGRSDFDASAVNAVIRTKILPPPPTPAQQDMIIVFNSLEVQ